MGRNKKILPLILIILDGWGINKLNIGNAIALAKTPAMTAYAKKYPYTLLHAHGRYVGLPNNQVGNSEAGHMNIGAGRLVEQDAVKINKAIKDGTFFKNSAFLEAIAEAQKKHSKIHLMGLLSDQMSPHSDIDHIIALAELVEKKVGLKNLYFHLFTDGRDSPQHEASNLVRTLRKKIDPNIKIATVMGRFYAMDRKKEWSRTFEAYNALVYGKGLGASDASEAIAESYNRNETDEFIRPYIIDKNGLIGDNDSVIFFNLRSDRARQLTKIFVQKDFNRHNPSAPLRKRMLKNVCFTAMTGFGPDLDGILTAYPSVDLKNTLPVVLKDYTQLYLAESEKYAHVTYFFNGGYPGTVDGEKQFMIPSPDVKSYEDSPGMRSRELTTVILKNLTKNKYDVTVVNFSGADMIGHTGNLKAGIKCCEIIDACLKKIVQAYLKKNGTVIITADHGNAEEMINLKTGEVDTEHSAFPVPFFLINKKIHNRLEKNRSLCDIAPTILQLLGVKKPKEMTGRSLIK